MFRTFVGFTVVVVAASVVVSAQTASRVPRTPDGKPDLQGMYDLAMLTPVERPNGLPAVLTDEQAAKMEKQAVAVQQAGSLPINGDRSAPPKGGDGSVGPAGNVGGYNSFWIDRGSQYTIVDGQKRSSIVIDPPDGKVPQMTPEARQRLASRFAAARLQSPANRRSDAARGGRANTPSCRL